jgi:hypothetical protein
VVGGERKRARARDSERDGERWERWREIMGGRGTLVFNAYTSAHAGSLMGLELGGREGREGRKS